MEQQPVQPDREDVVAVERQYGPLPDNASISEQAQRYRLYQCAKLIRLYGPDASSSHQVLV